MNPVPAAAVRRFPFLVAALAAASLCIDVAPAAGARRSDAPRAEAAKPAPAPAAPASDAPEHVVVASFTPQGIVKEPRQVVARFSAAMVPFGDLRDVEPPFRADCPVAGKSRWIDATTWSYDFDRTLPGGLRCVFTLRENLESLDGRPIADQRIFVLSTGGPSIRSSWPPDGASSIEEEPVFLLSLDAEVDFEAERGRIGFFVDGLPERIDADRVQGEELDRILKSLSKWNRPQPPLLALRPRRTLPSSKRVRLEWAAGIRAPGGEPTPTPQVLTFQTREPFSLSTRCRRENANTGCLPITPLSVTFTAPVAHATLAALRLVAPDGTRREPAPPKDDDDGPGSEGFAHEVTFAPPFVENATYMLELPADVVDDAGRRLTDDPAERTIRIGPVPVLAKFSARFGILERHADPALPVTLRNVEPELKTSDAVAVAAAGAGVVDETVANLAGTDLRVAADDPKKILGWLRRVSVATRRHSVFEVPPPPAGQAPAAEHDETKKLIEAAAERRAFTLPKPAPAVEAEVVGIPLASQGLHIVEIESPLLGAALLGEQRSMYVPAAVLVTNLAVHFKWGGERSIAWVTTLDTAKPVAAARVVVADCHGRELAAGETDADGIARFDGLTRTVPDCPEPARFADDEWRDWNESPALSALRSGVLVVARTADDLSFVHSSWDGGIEAWRFGVPTSYDGERSPAAMHTIFDRPVYRQGETVHMKHVVRSRTLAGFAIPRAEGRPTIAMIEHEGSGQSWPVKLAVDDDGVATSDWEIPPGARLGRYAVTVQDDWNASEIGSFRVEQFRVPLMRGDVTLPPVLAPQPASVEVDIAVRYLAGGAASSLPVLLRHELREGAYAAPEDFDDFTFASGPLEKDDESYWYDDEDEEDEDAGAAGDGAAESPTRPHRELTLDAAGAARATIDGLPAVEVPTDLVVEAEFRDPNGETVNVATTRTLLPAAVVAGIAVDDWADSAERLRVRTAVRTADGQPAADVPVRIESGERRWSWNRKRVVGGFYEYDNRVETKRLGLFCEGRTDASGLFSCEAAAPAKGQVLLEATATDAEGRRSVTHTTAWIGDVNEWGFSQRAGERIELVPEKRAYEPGETARLQVRMPFREATALVTTEREGVATARVVALSGEHPVVEVPITGEQSPNVFVSVLVVRGRVGDVQPTAMLDLGRPAFKMGLVELRVDWKTHRLAVEVKSDREVYRTRETARVHLRVRDADGNAPPPGAEAAVAAVDEGLLELLPNDSWKLLDAMMSRRVHRVDTSTAQGEVIGKRHYGRKAVATGGGGGSGSGRELFDTLLSWQPRIKLDANGEADVEVPINDSLTGFRIVAVATAGADRFGTGETTIRASRELQVLSGLPPLVREGDQLTAEFTVRNTGQAPIVAHAFGAVGGRPEDDDIELAPKKLELAPGEAGIVTWPVTIPSGPTELRWTMTASAPGLTDDRMLVRQKVVPALPVRVVQSTIAQLEGSQTTPVRAPADADPSAAGSGVRVSAARSLAASVQPIRDWLSRYPYTCLEQRVSKAIGMEDEAAWKTITDQLESYVDADGLLRYFPTSADPGDDRLTAYVLSIATAAGRPIPVEIGDRMKRGLAGIVDGTVVRPTGLALPDLTLRKLSAIEALARAGAAEPRLVSGILVQPELWPTSAVLDWWSILDRVQVADRDRLRSEAEQVLRARLDLSGTTLVFRTEAADRLWWMMAGPDSNSTRLLLQLSESGAWKDDAARVLRGAIARQDEGHWDTTTANAWGVVAMRAFAKRYESAPVDGRTIVALEGGDAKAAPPAKAGEGTPAIPGLAGSAAKKAQGEASFDWTAPEPPPVLLAWPAKDRADLVVRHEGAGAPWITTTSLAAMTVKETVASGYRIAKTVTAVERRKPGAWSRSDRVRVRLDIEAQRPMWWVVIDDPIPGGASHLASGLGRGAPPAYDDSWWRPGAADRQLYPAFVERTHEAWRAYFRFVPEGRSSIEYTIRLNQAGRFRLPPTRIEALYAPELFGETGNAPVSVEP